MDGERCHSRRVLVVDDDVDTASSYRDLLSLRGHTVEAAYNIRDALSVAREFKPTVVLCDLGLPTVADGLALARALRTIPGLQIEKLVAVSGYVLAEHVAAALASGFDDYVAKPAEFDRLLALVEQG